MLPHPRKKNHKIDSATDIWFQSETSEVYLGLDPFIPNTEESEFPVQDS